MSRDIEKDFLPRGTRGNTEESTGCWHWLGRRGCGGVELAALWAETDDCGVRGEVKERRLCSDLTKSQGVYSPHYFHGKCVTIPCLTVMLGKLRLSTIENLKPQGTQGCTEDPWDLIGTSLVRCARAYG